MPLLNLLNGVPGSPASPGQFSGRGGVQPVGCIITHFLLYMVNPAQ
jgi:hypothetical protein